MMERYLYFHKGVENTPFHCFGHFITMKFRLNKKDEGVRDMLIEQYDRLGIKSFEKEFEIDGSTVRRWKQLKAATGSSPLDIHIWVDLQKYLRMI